MARYESANPHANDDRDCQSQLYHDMPPVMPPANNWNCIPRIESGEIHA
jgi:hypothetical protein